MSDEEGINLDFDEVINFHEEMARQEGDANSDAGTRREAIGKFREGQGLQPKAFSQFRAGMKIKKPGDRADWLRSWEALIEVARDAIRGNQPEMDLEAGNVTPITPAPEDRVAPFEAAE